MARTRCGCSIASEPGGAFLATVGPEEGEGLGRVFDGPVYHASLSPTEYAARFAAAGMRIERFVAEDPDCDRRSVILALVPPDERTR